MEEKMKVITVFLASSDELKNDRNSFSTLISRLDKIFEPRGIRIRCDRWEDFPAYCTGKRTQDAYNEIVRSSDMCICMFHTLAGKYTIEEFNQAMDEYKSNNDHPKTYVYIRALVEGDVETQDLKDFKENLFKSIGHYWCNYANDDTMQLHFVMQLERLMPTMCAGLGTDSQIKVDNGVVTLQGVKVADYQNLPFASANSEYLALKEKYAQLDKDVAQLRAYGMEYSHPMLYDKLNERAKCHEDIVKMEKQLLDMAQMVNKSISSNAPMSERKRLAIEMFEQGNIKGVLDVLNEEDMAMEGKQAEQEIARGRELEKYSKALIENGIQTIRSQVEEYVLRAKALMMDYDNETRFEQACRSYESAISISRDNLPNEEIADLLFQYAAFLQDNNCFSKAEKIYTEVLSIRRELVKLNPQAYEPKLADTMNNLAFLYDETLRYGESEELYNQAVEIYCRLSAENPQTYEPNLARIMNNLGVLYLNILRFSDSEEKYKSALEIYKRLPKSNSQAYESIWAATMDNLGTLYAITQRFSDSEEMYKRVLKVRKRLSKSNPQVYEPDLACTMDNFANLYRDTQRFGESEEMYKRALEIRERLSAENPQAYEPDLAKTLNSMGTLYMNTQRFSDSEKMYKRALEIMKQLSKGYPQVYELDLALFLIDLANLYGDTQCFGESEKMYKQALEIWKRLSKANPEIYGSELVNTLNNLSFNCILNKHYADAEKYSREAIAIEPDYSLSYTNLASALLLQGKFTEAEAVYRKYKNEHKDDFLSDFAEFEKAGAIPDARKEDVERIKQMLME